MSHTTPGSMSRVLLLLLALGGTPSSTATRLTSTLPDHDRQVCSELAHLGHHIFSWKETQLRASAGKQEYQQTST